MLSKFVNHIGTHWREALGFSLFLAWIYMTLFGCGLAKPFPSFNGTPTTYGLEHIWSANGLGEALGAVALLTLSRLAPCKPFVRDPGRTATAAAAIGVLGTIVVWASWLERDSFHSLIGLVGGFLVGGGAALFTSAWGLRLSRLDEARIEAIVPLAFTISFAIYLVFLLAKTHHAINLVAAVALCLASRAAITCCKREESSEALRCAGSFPTEVWRGLGSFTLLVLASWMQVAFFRVISSPELSGDRFVHYLYPFLMAAAVSWVMLALCIRISRYLNISLAYRWSMPLFVLSYVPILLDYANPTLRMLAYALNFLGMFGVQYGCWLGATKYARRNRLCPAIVLSCYALGEGVGVFAGCRLGLYVVELDFSAIGVASLLLLAGVQMVVMSTGFNPSWIFRRGEHRVAHVDPHCEPTVPAAVPAPQAPAAVTAEETAAEPACESDTAALDELFARQAAKLQEKYQLTSRETVVATLLLAGRTRPFIRDELFISLNTVGVHVRNIFSKCGVHSQQELIDLARKGGE